VKRTLIGLFTGRMPSECIDPSTINLASCGRVLVVRVNVRMGNLLLVTPAFAALRQALPSAAIDVLCYEDYAPLLAHDPDLGQVHGFHRRMLCNPWALARLARRLRRARYDLVVDASRGASLFGAILAGVSGGRYRVAAAGSRYQRFFNVHVPRRPNLQHKVDLLLAFLGDLGVPPVTRSLRVVLTEAERALAEARWCEWGLTPGGPTVGVVVGARRRKRWPREDMRRLIQHLQARPGLTIVLLAGPEQREEASRLSRGLDQPVMVAPQVGIRDFAAVVSCCTLVVTADTGPMHLAAAVGVPTVAVFHATNARCYAPHGALHRAVQGEAARGIEGTLRAVGEILDRRGAATPFAITTSTASPSVAV